jgi:hypothetical protein
MDPVKSASFVNDFLNSVLFSRVNTWIFNSIENSINDSTVKGQDIKSLDHKTPGMIAFIVSLFFNGIRILFLSITLIVVVFINVIIYIVSNYHRWIMLGAIGVFALCLFVIFYLWDIIRKGINGVVIPGINGIIRGVAGFVNNIVRALKKIGIRANEMNDRGIQGEVPSLPGIAKALATPLLEAILRPFKAGPDDYSK